MKSDRPKAMHCLAGQPMVKLILSTIETLSPDQIVVVVGPDMEDVSTEVAPHPSVIFGRYVGEI